MTLKILAYLMANGQMRKVSSEIVVQWRVSSLMTQMQAM
jgi:hypothetical protein